MGSLLAGVSILVADDDADGADLLDFLLTSAGATVRTAAQATDVLDVLSGWTPNVLLLDISLPDMDGCDLLSTIRLRPALRGVPAIAISGFAHRADRERAEKSGFEQYVTKPYDGDALVRLVHGLAARAP
jgi:CheY-like chemotaxis protein